MVQTRRGATTTELMQSPSSPTAAAAGLSKSHDTASSARRVVTPSPKKTKTAPSTTSRTKRTAVSPTKHSTMTTTTDGILTSSQVASVNDKECYVDLKVPPVEFRPSATLTIGQCFHWRVVHVQSDDDDDDDDSVLQSSSSPKRSRSTAANGPASSASAWGTHDSTEWVGVLRFFDRTANKSNSIVISMKQTPSTTLYRVLHETPTHVNVAALLRDYFRLEEPLEPLYQQWSQADPDRLGRIADCIPGLRTVQQDPWECLVSFICSSNNNIPRITKMLQAIRQKYGQPLVTIGNETFYSFPSFNALRERATESDLRRIGMGYRAKYLMETMATLHSLGGEEYLHELRSIQDDPANVQEALTQFCGVGRKVADCVALFSLRQDNAIPVDVHVWDIARRDFDVDGSLGRAKSLTPTIYNKVGDLFRSRFPKQAGWAHSLLFVAELPSFRPILPTDLVDEMDQFSKLEQDRKLAAREAKRKRKEPK